MKLVTSAVAISLALTPSMMARAAPSPALTAITTVGLPDCLHSPPPKAASFVMRIYLRPTIEEIFVSHPAFPKPIFYDTLPEPGGPASGDLNSAGHRNSSGNSSVTANLYHSDIAHLPNIMDGDVIEYRIIFDRSKIPNVKFFRTNDASGINVLGVAVQQGDHKFLCNTPIDDTEGTLSVAAFYMIYHDNGTPTFDGFSIALVGAGAPETPIFIDPKILNNG